MKCIKALLLILLFCGSHVFVRSSVDELLQSSALVELEQIKRCIDQHIIAEYRAARQAQQLVSEITPSESMLLFALSEKVKDVTCWRTYLYHAQLLQRYKQNLLEN